MSEITIDDFDYKGFAEWLQSTGLQITPVPEQPSPPEPTEFQKRIIDFIKSFKEPPINKNDLYHDHDVWSKFGCVSAGIGEHWAWYLDHVILSKATDQDLCEAAQVLIAPSQEIAALIRDKFGQKTIGE